MCLHRTSHSRVIEQTNRVLVQGNTGLHRNERRCKYGGIVGALGIEGRSSGVLKHLRHHGFQHGWKIPTGLAVFYQSIELAESRREVTLGRQTGHCPELMSGTSQ